MHIKVRYSSKVSSYSSSPLCLRLSFTQYTCIFKVRHCCHCSWIPLCQLIYQPENAVFHHYLECESVWRLQFGLYYMVWDGVCCLLWVVLSTEACSPSIAPLADHPDSDGCTVLACHSCRKAPQSIPSWPPPQTSSLVTHTWSCLSSATDEPK